MLSVPANYKTQNEAVSKRPVYVAEIFWNNGNAGTDGTNDIYFATCDVNDITGFTETTRWFPFLKAESIGSMSQQVDPINGVSSIGSLDVTITDYQGKVSDIIKAADAAGHGLRRQRIAIYKLHKGGSWATDKVCIRTMQINDLRLTSLNEYRLTAADVQRQMQKTVFNPYSTALAAAITTTGAITASVEDARNLIATTQQVHGTCGFIKVNNEIMRWTAKTDGSLTIGASDRGYFSTTAATHAQGDKVSEIIVLRENPITMALKIMESSGTASTNGSWDAHPARWGCNMDSSNDIDEAGILEVGKLLTGLSSTPAAADGVQFEFVLEEGIEAKRFVEDSIFKVLGCFGFVRGDGKYSIRAYSDLANAAKENAVAILDQNAVVKWGDLTYNYNDLANQVWIEYDEQPKLSGKFIRTAIFIDSISIKKWGEARQLKYQAQGVIPTSVFASQLYQRFQRILARYSRPPMQIPLTLLPKYHLLEIGDIVRVSLPIRDLLTGAALDRAFEVISTQLVPDTGEVQVNCIAQPERAQTWFGGVGDINSVTVSPGTANIPTGSTLQMVVRAFDGSGRQVNIPAISWIATGNVTVDSAGVVTAGAVGSGTVYAVVGDKVSNAAAITITASANTNPVASVAVMPSAVSFKAGDTQQMVAVAYDASGNMVNGVTFNWNSSNTGVATLPAGSGTSKLLTAVADGSSNITATETVSSIVSAAVPAVVAVPPTPDYVPPALADSAYQIGTKITTHGPVGGPHVIPNGYNFAAGDYWYDGDVSLAVGSTCNINGTVRIFSLGTITINGTVDGKGRGFNSRPGVTLSAMKGQLPGLPGTLRGFASIGGTGAFGQGVGAQPLNASVPVVNVIGTAESGGSWTAVSGLPTVLEGSQAGSGSVVSWYFNPTTSGASGESGAGLLLMARGIYITTGLVDLRGNNGYAPSSGGGPIAGGAGGGGGGSLVALAEKNAHGLPVMSILPARVKIDGGIHSSSVLTLGYTGMVEEATDGGPGAVVAKVIG